MGEDYLHDLLKETAVRTLFDLTLGLAVCYSLLLRPVWCMASARAPM